MPDTILLEGPVDIDRLAAFLTEHAESGCMTLSELDGYLAGVVVSPTILLPSAWLNEIWGDDGPPFADAAQAHELLGVIMRRYNEVIRQLGEGPSAYRLILDFGKTRAESVIDWGIGFMRVLSLDPDAWFGVLQDRNGGACLAPILALAAEMPMSIDVSEFRLPEAELQKLIADADGLLAMCVCGLQRLCRQRVAWPARRQPKRGKKAQRART